MDILYYSLSEKKTMQIFIFLDEIDRVCELQRNLIISFPYRYLVVFMCHRYSIKYIN